jgi:hypothetical protein
VAYKPFAKRRLCKQRPLIGNARNIRVPNNRKTGVCNPFLSKGSVIKFPLQRTPTQNSRTVFSMWSLPRYYKQGSLKQRVSDFFPCGGGVEYIHRSPASRRRRQKWNPVPGSITGPPCCWVEGDLALQAVSCQLRVSFARAAMTREPGCGKLR